MSTVYFYIVPALSYMYALYMYMYMYIDVRYTCIMHSIKEHM